MIICGNCGARNEDGVTFCGTCGRYLDFVGEPEDPPAASTASTASAGPQPVAPSPPPPAPQPVLAGDAAPPRPPGPAPRGDSSSGAQPLVVPVEAAQKTRSAQAAPKTGTATEAEALEAPRVAPVLPGAPAAKRPLSALPPEERTVEPGERICGNCGAGNVPTRKFCRRCGADLVDAPVAPPPPWWRRLFQRDRSAAGKGKATPTWEQRRRRVVRRSYRGKIAFVTVLALLGAGGWYGREPINRVFQSAIDRAGSTRSVPLLHVDASSAARGHPAALVQDRKTSTFWAPAGRGDGRFQYVDIRFREPFRLVAVVLFNGASLEAEQFDKQARPTILRFTFVRAGGPPTTKDVRLDDNPGKQVLYFGIDKVARARVQILESAGVQRGRLVALGEMEFRERAN